MDGIYNLSENNNNKRIPLCCEKTYHNKKFTDNMLYKYGEFVIEKKKKMKENYGLGIIFLIRKKNWNK